MNVYSISLGKEKRKLEGIVLKQSPNTKFVQVLAQPKKDDPYGLFWVPRVALGNVIGSRLV
jgi:hypothetical protein